MQVVSLQEVFFFGVKELSALLCRFADYYSSTIQVRGALTVSFTSVARLCKLINPIQK